MNRRIRMSGFVCFAAFTTCCGGSGSPPTGPAPGPGATLQITDLPSGPLVVGQTVSLRAMAAANSGTSDVTTAAAWRTSNPAIAVISASGELTATGPGETDVQASYQTLNAAARIRVEPRSPTDDKLKVAVLAMDSRGNPSASDVERVFARASVLFEEKTGVALRLVDFASAAPGNPLTEARSYVTGLGPGRIMPDGVLALANDAQAVSFGGYSQVFALPPPALNAVPSPFHPPTAGYLAVQNFVHIYGRCGYDPQGNRIGDRSANGECRNQSGLLCVNNGRNWVCPNIANDLYAEDDYFAACTIVHEFAHPFGPAGNADHYGTQQCTARTGMTPAQVSDLRLFQQSCGMCPDVYRNVRR